MLRKITETRRTIGSPDNQSLHDMNQNQEKELKIKSWNEGNFLTKNRKKVEAKKNNSITTAQQLSEVE